MCNNFFETDVIVSFVYKKRLYKKQGYNLEQFFLKSEEIVVIFKNLTLPEY